MPSARWTITRRVSPAGSQGRPNQQNAEGLPRNRDRAEGKGNAHPGRQGDKDTDGQNQDGLSRQAREGTGRQEHRR
jgi:hypothetical protein